MANDYYVHGSWPATGGSGASAPARSELDAITVGFDKLPALTGNASKAVVINGAATGLTVTVGTLALAGNFATLGAFATTLTVTGTTTLTLPTTGTLATLAGAETLTNKTITSPILTLETGLPTAAGRLAYSGGFITMGDGAANRVLVSEGQTQTLSNKLFFSSSNVWGGASRILDSNDSHDISRPDLTGNDTMITAAATQTLTGKTINLASNTLSGTTAQFNAALSDNDFATLAGIESLSSKTLVSPVLSGTMSGGTFSGTYSGTASGATFNLTSNTLVGTTAQFNAALSDNDFATLAGTETLTGKTINLASNTLTGTTAQFNTALSDGDFATLAGTETFTNKAVIIPINTQTAGYTLVLGDAGKLVDMDNAGATTLTVPTNASVAFQTGTQILFRQKGAGQVTVAGAGVTLQASNAALKTFAQHSVGGLTKVATDTWVVNGDMIA